MHPAGCLAASYLIRFALQWVQGSLMALKTPGVPSRDQNQNILPVQKERSADRLIFTRVTKYLLFLKGAVHMHREMDLIKCINLLYSLA